MRTQTQLTLVSDTKVCGDRACAEVNPQSTAAFSKNSASKDGLQHRCRVCAAKAIKKHQQNNPEKWALYARKYRANNQDKHRQSAKRYQTKYPDRVKNTALKRVFGITLAQYNQLYAEQRGCCAICKKHSTEFLKNLAVDHSHKTGKIRALLCHKCNTSLGLLNENVDLLNAAILYLKVHHED